MVNTFFITGTGTGIGKTVVAAIIAEALGADYWKPIQAGYEEGTDSEWVSSVVSNPGSQFFPETYKFKLPASPHIAAQNENTRISIEKIKQDLLNISGNGRILLIEGAGGLMVPLNEKETVLDLILHMGTPVILVSRNYLGSINHSLLTAEICHSNGIPVKGWIFTDKFMDYEMDIARLSNYPVIASVGKLAKTDKETLREKAVHLKAQLIKSLL